MGGQECLRDGEKGDEGICTGLVQSDVFLCLLSSVSRVLRQVGRGVRLLQCSTAVGVHRGQAAGRLLVAPQFAVDYAKLMADQLRLQGQARHN